MSYEKRIIEIIRSLPPYLQRAARIGYVVVSDQPAQVGELAQYQHETRNLYVSPGLRGDTLRHAVVHEIGHAIDDNFGVGHYFGESPEWVTLSREALGYGDDAPSIETFAEHFARRVLYPVDARQSPVVATFIDKTLAFLHASFGAPPRRALGRPA